MTVSADILSVPKAPFRGLRPFRFVDSPIFFAREAETQKSLRLITIYRAVLLYGDSGTGKSSLVRAGLVPQALKEGFLPETLRVQPRLGEEFVVERILSSESDRPEYLPSILVPKESSERSVLSAEQLFTRIQEASPDRTPLLILDQFEEWITLADPYSTKPTEGTQKAQERILDALVALIRDHSIPVKLLFVFREDYLAKLNRLFRRCPDLVDQYLRLAPLPTGVLLRIVRGPFTLKDIPDKHWPAEISASLAEEIRQEIAAREYSVLNLSEIQVVCLRLWASGNPEELYHRNKISGILEDFLASSLSGLGPVEAPAVALLSRMVTGSGTRNVISGEDLLDRTHKEDGFSRASLTRALDALVDETKLVNREIRNETFFYEIVSEFLVPWIFQQKLKLAQKAARARLRNRLLLGLGASLVLLATWAIWYRQQNTAAARQAAIVRELEASKKRTDQLLTESVDRDSFKKEAYRQLQEAQGERDSLKGKLAANQDYDTALKSTLSSVQKELDSVRQSNADLTKRLAQSEDARQKSDAKVAELQVAVDKSGARQGQSPSASTNVVAEPVKTGAREASMTWQVMQNDRFWGSSTTGNLVPIEITIHNSTAWDLQIDSVTIIQPKGRISTVSDFESLEVINAKPPANLPRLKPGVLVTHTQLQQSWLYVVAIYRNQYSGSISSVEVSVTAYPQSELAKKLSLQPDKFILRSREIK